MAGESPGKSEQRKSSGTAPEERDPRLSVFREPAGPSDGARAGSDEPANDDTTGDATHPDPGSGPDGDAPTGTESGSTPGPKAGSPQDDATAVFRVPLKDAPADGTAAPDAPTPAAQADEVAQEPADEAPAPETGATAEDAGESGNALGDEAPDAENAAAQAPEGPAEPSGADSGPSEADPTPSGASGAVESPASAPAAPDADEAPADAAEAPVGADEAPADAENASEGDTAADGETSPGDKRLRTAVAAWVGKTDAAAGPGKPAEPPAPGKGAGAGNAAGAPEESAGDAKPAEIAKPAGDAKPAESTKPAGDAKPAEDAKPTEDAKPAAPEPPAGDEEPSETRTTGATVPRTREEAAPAAPVKAATGGKSSGATADANANAASDTEPGADAGSPADADADGTGIDQPTAVFKAVGSRIDQPTTALKLPRRETAATTGPKKASDPEPAPDTGSTPAAAPTPDAAADAKSVPAPVSKPEPRPGSGTDPESKPGSAPDTKPKPESAAERTSTFVPLRSDDVRTAPASRRPDPQGPGAGPGATPALGTPPSDEPDRTRSLPLPPKPPLDLLAELTNTPPPRETPVRTAVRRVKIWTPLVLLLLIVFAAVQMFRPLPDPSLAVTTKPTYTFDGAAPDLSWPDQGQGWMAATGLGRVGSFGKQKPVPIASVAKAMTAYIVLRDHPMKKGADGESIKVDAKGESDGKLSSEGESTLDTVKEGDVLTQRDALSAIMIPSANNIARLLARWDAGSEKAFVEKMNATAKELGMVNTTYTDPSGLNATTVSTAEDLVKLGEKLVEIPALMEITVLPSWTDPTGKAWPNYNRLVPFDGALGIKTGSTTKAGGNLLFAAHKMIDGTDQLIVGAILGQYDSQSIIDEVNRVSKTVMIATQDALEGATIVKKGQVVGVVDDGLGTTTPVVATKDVKAVGWGGLTVKLELTDGGETVPHAAVAGTHVGTLTVGEGSSRVEVAVALAEDLSEPGFGAKLSRIG
ncbi:serine hydrolase [Streptomyces sp. AM 2-1-1]|uniref:D-alanyl-D-alanine carboxypeptidase family protein n=1 Tax=Streptomyces sp. AM 2-1-1 TaxID=3028709 RepID=UPI0023B97E29|nr:serine hydrolase [Streptomyces sp. AM 2-1-1]WEH40290.1 hypothetical protein PZB77_12630 [Streptomyces sp. AM 2-1-1]